MEDFIASVPIHIYIALAVLLLTTLNYIRKLKELPPGLVGLPLLGYWPFLKPDTCHLQLDELGKKYGRVFSFKCTDRLYINLGSTKAIREALVTKSEFFALKPEDKTTLLNIHLNPGLINLNGEHWRTVRKFLLQQFRERGLIAIKDSLSGQIYDTIEEAVKELKDTKGQPVDIASVLLSKCNNVMRLTLFGGNGMSERELEELCDAYRQSLSVFSSTNILLSGRFAKYFILPFIKSTKDAQEGSAKVNNLLQTALNRRRATFDEHHVRDIFDAYLKEKKDRMARNDPAIRYFTDDVLVVSLNQIAGDGIYFLTLFIAEFIKTLIKYPKEQEKIYEELIEVIGLDRNPTIEDKSKLPYTNAFISEVLRYADILTIFTTSECSRETTLSGYKIPKGAVLLYNFWMAHNNPEDYEHPEKFNPSRYIAKDGKKPELPIVFGMGKRACIGEGYTMNQIFLFVTTIVKNFVLRNPETDKNDKSSLFFLENKVFVCAHPRN